MEVTRLVNHLEAEEIELLREMVGNAYQRAHTAGQYSDVAELAIVLDGLNRIAPQCDSKNDDVIFDVPSEEPIYHAADNVIALPGHNQEFGVTSNEYYTYYTGSRFELRIPFYQMQNPGDQLFRLLLLLYLVAKPMAHGERIGSKTLRRNLVAFYLSVYKLDKLFLTPEWQNTRLSRIADHTILYRADNSKIYVRTDREIEGTYMITSDFSLKVKNQPMRMSGPLDDWEFPDEEVS